MEIKKELTVAGFVNLSIIYEIIDFNLNVVADGLTGNYAEEIIQDLENIYELVTSAVTLKDGKQPKSWEGLPLSDCAISMSYETANEIAERVKEFNEKAKEKYWYYDKQERVIAGNIEDTKLELAIECLQEMCIVF